MRITGLFFLSVVVFGLILLVGCSSSTPESNISNTTAANTKTPITSPSVGAKTNAPMPIVSPSVVANADTNAPCNVYAAYHAALVRNDEAALRKTLTQASIRQLETEAKAEGEKTIVGSLNAYGKPSPQPAVCGGTVQGNVAMLQVKEGTTGVVTTRRAVRENNEWKLDLLSVDFK